MLNHIAGTHVLYEQFKFPSMVSFVNQSIRSQPTVHHKASTAQDTNTNSPLTLHCQRFTTNASPSPIQLPIHVHQFKMDSYEAAEIARVRYMQYQAARHDTIQARVAEGLARRIARAAARTARATARWQRTDENPVQWETATRQATDHPTVVRFRRLQPGEPFTNALTRGEVIFNSHGNVVPINSRGEYAPALSGTTPQRATDVPPQVFADDGTPIKREDSDDREFPAAYSRDPVAFSDHIERKRRREVGEEEEAITGKKQKREASPKSDVTIKREEEDDVVTVWQAAPVTPIISLTSGTPITSLSPDFEAIALLRRLEDLDVSEWEYEIAQFSERDEQWPPNSIESNTKQAMLSIRLQMEVF